MKTTDIEGVGNAQQPHYDPDLAYLNLERPPEIPESELPKNRHSRDHEEEELAYLSGIDTYFTNAEVKKFTGEVLETVVEFLGTRISEDQIRLVIPRYKVGEIPSLDDSTIKIYLLNTQNWSELEKLRRGDNSASLDLGRAFMTGILLDKDSTGPSDGAHSDTSPRKMIVVRDIAPEMLAKNSTTSCNDIEQELKSTLTHEMLHCFRAGDSFPGYLVEGVVEYYSLALSDKPTKLSEGEDILYSYRTPVSIVSLLTQVMHETGIPDDEIDRHFLSNTTEDFQFIVDFISTRYGGWVAEKMFFKPEVRPMEVLPLLKRKESGLDTKIGKFLKANSQGFSGAPGRN